MKHSRTLVLLLLTLTSQLSFSTENTAKDFTVPSATDNSLIRLADYSGKVILLNWWRTSCPWSQKESPRLRELYKQYRGKGLVIIGISDDTADTVSHVPTYLKNYGITWPVGLNDQGEFMREIRPLGQGETPGNYLISRSGKITYLGLDRKPEDWQKLEEAVGRALAESLPTSPAVKPREVPRAPSFSLSDVQKKPVRLADFAGKPLVVNFFNAQTCDWASSVFAKLHSYYGARGLKVVGIDLFDDETQLRACMTKYDLRYPILRGDQATQMAWINDTKGWATFFVTPDGKVLKKIVDSIDNGLEGPVFSRYAEYLLTNR